MGWVDVGGVEVTLTTPPQIFPQPVKKVPDIKMKKQMKSVNRFTRWRSLIMPIKFMNAVRIGFRF